jgi:hypothetical protein
LSTVIVSRRPRARIVIEYLRTDTHPTHDLPFTRTSIDMGSSASDSATNGSTPHCMTVG